jgi:hypothetical protein
MMTAKFPDYTAVNSAAMSVLPNLLRRWLPDGRIEGDEFVARNPVREDRRPGSFKINLRTGKWADFATEDRGCGAVSLAAYLLDLTHREAARRLSKMLEIDDAT